MTVAGVLFVSLDDVSERARAAAYTPNLDSLERLTRFWGAVNCSQARAIFETGVYAIDPLNRVGGLFGAQETSSLQIGPHLIANRLVTKTPTQCGKWHLSSWDHLNHRGQCGYVDYGGSISNLRPHGGSQGGEGTYFDWKAIVNGAPEWVLEYATDWTVDRAAQSIGAGAEFVVCSLNAVHKPIHAPPGAPFAGVVPMLEYADAKLGEVFDIARGAGYAIVAAVDNGGTKETGGKGTLGARALNCFAGVDGITVLDPDAPCSFADLHATIVDILTGSAPPTGDGVSLIGGHPDIVFADLFEGVNVDPLPIERMAAATDGALKVVRDYEQSGTDEEWQDLDWEDEPTAEDTSHLRAAIEAREA